MLAIVGEYILVKATLVQIDHQPLERILHKPMSVAPLCLQAMILKVSGFDLKVEYLPEKKKKTIVAETLSRASLDEVPAEEDELQVNMVERISISETKYAELQKNTANELHAFYTMIQVGWPEKSHTVSGGIGTHVMN